MEDRENQRKQISEELRQIEEKQLQNRQELARIEELEQSFFELNGESQRLFDRLYAVWRQDKDFAKNIEQNESEFQQRRQQVKYELEEKKQEFLETKRELFDLEDELHWRKRSLDREG